MDAVVDGFERVFRVNDELDQCEVGIAVANGDSVLSWNSISGGSLDNNTSDSGAVVYNSVSSTVNGSQTASNYMVSNNSAVVLGDDTVFGASGTKAVIDGSSTLFANANIAASVENNGKFEVATGGTSVGGFSGSGVTEFNNTSGINGGRFRGRATCPARRCSRTSS